MFKKYAQVNVVASGNSLTEVYHSLKKTASYYANEDTTQPIDIQGILNEVSDEYNVSKDPNDYYFVAVRANSVAIPNENGDAFSEDELQRFDHHLARRVYQTYIAKPLHVNHRADNPVMARGVIFDAHYNKTSPLSKEKKASIKNSYGVDLNNDEFVEVLIGIDKTKDPHLANGIQKGLLDSFSMGCECEKTRCSVCNHVAHTKLEFCKHIRHGKMKPSKRNDGIEIKAFEWCEGVVFNELSSVDQPADPEALTQEVLDIQGKIAQLENSQSNQKDTIETQSQLLLLNARLNKLEETMGGIMSKRAQFATPITTPVPMSAPGQPPMGGIASEDEEDKREDMEAQTEQPDDIKEFRDEEERKENEEGPMTPDEIGIVGSKYKYANAYMDYKARQLKDGILILSPKGAVVMDIRQSRQANKLTAIDVLRAIAKHGLSMTAKKYKALVQYKNAQGGVIDYAVQDKDSDVVDEKMLADDSMMDRYDDEMKNEDYGEQDVGSSTSEGEISDKQDEPDVRSPVVGTKKAQNEEELPKEEPVEEAKPFEGEEIPEEEALEHQMLMEKEGATPEGFEPVVQELKKDPDIDNPWAVAWWMKGKGYEPKEGQFEMNAMEGEENEFKNLVAEFKACKSAQEEISDVPVVGEKEPEMNEEVPEQSVIEEEPPMEEKQAQNEAPPAAGTLQGAEDDTEEQQIRDEKDLSVLDAQESDKEEKREEKAVDEPTQEEAIRDHVEKLEARLKTLYKNRQAKAIKDFQESFSARFIRAAKLAIRREALNLEASLIKQSMADSLMTPLKIGSDEVLPLDSQSTIALIERAITPTLMNSYIDNLLSRSAKLMKMSDESLMQLEEDANNLQPVEPPTDEDEEEEILKEKEANLKYKASQGNPILSPSSSDFVRTDSRFDKSASIRDALSGTIVSSVAHGVSGAVLKSRD